MSLKSYLSIPISQFIVSRQNKSIKNAIYFQPKPNCNTKVTKCLSTEALFQCLTRLSKSEQNNYFTLKQVG